MRGFLWGFGILMLGIGIVRLIMDTPRYEN